MTKNEKKDYLNLARHLDVSIQSKMELLNTQKGFTAMTTSVISHAPSAKTRNIHLTEDIIAEMLDLEAEVNNDILKLQKQKHEIFNVVRQVENQTYRTVLELKYLCYKNWKDISNLMNYSIQNIYKLHDKALEAVHIPKSVEQIRVG